MTATATLPIAAQRLVRSAAGRRALQVALFLGGLLALALLCSGQAHASESGPEVPDITGEVRSLDTASVDTASVDTAPLDTASVETAPVESAPAELESATPKLESAKPEQATPEPVTEGLESLRTPVRSTTDVVTRDVPRAVTRTLGDLSEDAERAAAVLPEPRLPKAPPLPGGDL
ncbi:hypothetical protein P8605_44680, partial [Streptomyces sp. T-3]|nr:hypothetical protein [Streptomyces sp. T-3]